MRNTHWKILRTGLKNISVASDLAPEGSHLRISATRIEANEENSFWVITCIDEEEIVWPRYRFEGEMNSVVGIHLHHVFKEKCGSRIAFILQYMLKFIPRFRLGSGGLRKISASCQW